MSELDFTIFDSDGNSNSKPEWKLRVNSSEPEIAEGRTYYLNSHSETQEKAQGILANDPKSDLTIFHSSSDEWQPQKINKFDLFEDLDDFPNPLAVGQLLPNLSGQVEEDIIWDLTTGDFEAVSRIEDEELREKADRIMDRLEAVKAWDDELEEDLEMDSLDLEFDHCSSCGFGTLHKSVETLLGSKWVCSSCGNPNAGIYQISA